MLVAGEAREQPVDGKLTRIQPIAEQEPVRAVTTSTPASAAGDRAKHLRQWPDDDTDLQLARASRSAIEMTATEKRSRTAGSAAPCRLEFFRQSALAAMPSALAVLNSSAGIRT